MQKRWNIIPFDNDKVNALFSALTISKTICKILTQRGIDDFENLKTTSDPD